MAQAPSDTPFLRNRVLEATISSLVQAGNFERAFQIIAIEMERAASNDAFLARQIYVPGLDSMIEQISRGLAGASGRQTATALRMPVIVATAIQAEGGHSRIIEDLVSMLDGAIVILTNFFSRQASRPVLAPRAIGSMPVLSLPADTACGNAMRLRDLGANLASHVYLLTHHHDVVALAATASGLSCPVYFIHHSDHRPSLGNTIKRFTHVDLVPHMQRFCTEHLGGTVHYWPMGVQDRGAKQFQYPLATPATASAATWMKFAWQGELSYPAIVSDLLRSGVGRHYHFGWLPDEKLKTIHDELASHGIAADRFVYVGTVKSLWERLVNLPVHVFVGSAPLHGLRTSMEVQGAGIPFCPYRQDVRSLMHESGNFDPATPAWENRAELVSCVAEAFNRHEEAARRARRHYEEFFTMARMKAAIGESHRISQSQAGPAVVSEGHRHD